MRNSVSSYFFLLKESIWREKVVDIHTFLCFPDTSTPKRSEILTILKIKNILQDEIKKRKSLERQLQKAQEKLINLNVNTEDSIR